MLPEVRAAQRAAAISLAATVAVVAVKLAGAWGSRSVSVLSEGLQSILDIAMSAVAMAAVGYAAKPPDSEHPYGHGKAELLAGALQMVVILGTGVYILFRAYDRYLHPESIRWDLGALTMAYAIASNLVVASYLRKVERRTRSASLAAEAAHLAGDTVMSAGVLVGMLLVGLFQHPALDPATAAVTVGWGMAVAVRHLARLAHPLMDGALPSRDIAELERILQNHPEVRGYHNLRTREVGRTRFLDLHVMLDDELSFVRAHEVAEQIEDDLRRALGGAVVSIHYEPHIEEVRHRRMHHPEG